MKKPNVILPLASFVAGTLLTLAAPTAWAQTSAPRAPSTVPPREEVLGYDGTQNVVGYIQRTATVLAGFSDVTLVTLARDGSEQRVRYTSDADMDQLRGSHDRAGVQSQIDARVNRDIDAARARFTPGNEFPVSLRGNATGNCARPPFTLRSFTVGNGFTADVQPASDGRGSTLTLRSGTRTGAPVTLPAVTLTQGATTVPIPYDTVADLRELPAGDALVVMVRSNACTVDGTSIPARVVIVPPLPPPEHPLDALPHAELSEGEVIRAVAPHARRRTVDEIDGFYDRRAHVIFNNAWVLPEGNGEKFLVEYSRVEDGMSPLTAVQGTLGGHFAVLQREGGRLRVRSELLPPPGENVYAGTGQEAFHADLDADGHDEIIVRSHYLPNGEVTVVLHLGFEDALSFVWRTTTRSDDRSTGGSSDVRQCSVGIEGRTLVVRCRVLHYAPGATGPNAPVLSSQRAVQRVRWTGGTVEIDQVGE